MELMRPCKFTTSDTDEVFDGWTDGTFHNGWLSVYLTRCQVVEFLSPIRPVFMEPNTFGNTRDYPVLQINNGREFEFFESCPIWTGEEFVEMYNLEMELIEYNEKDTNS